MEEIPQNIIYPIVTIIARMPFISSFMHYFLTEILQMKISLYRTMGICLSIYLFYAIIMYPYTKLIQYLIAYHDFSYGFFLIGPPWVLAIISSIVFLLISKIRFKIAVFAGAIMGLSDFGLRALYWHSPLGGRLELLSETLAEYISKSLG